MNPKKKILIIDDEEDFCFIFKSYLLKKGCDAFVAHSLDAGFKLIDTVKPDVVFLDNNLPDGDGWEKAELIHHTYPSVKLNLISAYNQNITPSPYAHANIW